jgi:hypothetical protein
MARRYHGSVRCGPVSVVGRSLDQPTVATEGLRRSGRTAPTTAIPTVNTIKRWVAGVERSEPPENGVLGARFSFLASRPQPPVTRHPSPVAGLPPAPLPPPAFGRIHCGSRRHGPRRGVMLPAHPSALLQTVSPAHACTGVTLDTIWSGSLLSSSPHTAAEPAVDNLALACQFRRPSPGLRARLSRRESDSCSQTLAKQVLKSRTTSKRETDLPSHLYAVFP